MSGVISLPHFSPTGLSNWSYRMLMMRLQQRLERDDDAFRAFQAEIFQALNFGAIDDAETARRLARTLATVAHELRAELIEQASDDPRNIGFIDYLAELEMLLTDLIA